MTFSCRTGCVSHTPFVQHGRDGQAFLEGDMIRPQSGLAGVHRSSKVAQALRGREWCHTTIMRQRYATRKPLISRVENSVAKLTLCATLRDSIKAYTPHESPSYRNQYDASSMDASQPSWRQKDFYCLGPLPFVATGSWKASGDATAVLVQYHETHCAMGSSSSHS